MKQKIISTAIILSALFGLTACSGESAPMNFGSVSTASTPERFESLSDNNAKMTSSASDDLIEALNSVIDVSEDIETLNRDIKSADTEGRIAAVKVFEHSKAFIDNVPSSGGGLNDGAIVYVSFNDGSCYITSWRERTTEPIAIPVMFMNVVKRARSVEQLAAEIDGYNRGMKNGGVTDIALYQDGKDADEGNDRGVTILENGKPIASDIVLRNGGYVRVTYGHGEGWVCFGLSEQTSATTHADNWEDFIGADGQPVTLEGATIDEDGRVTLDYCFIKYAPQVYDDTFKNPDLINWETLDFAPFDGDYTPEVKRVRAGDVLENGLEVKEAYRTLEYQTYMDEITCEPRSAWGDYFGMITFNGELTLSGALYCVPEDDYLVSDGSLYFYPDTSDFACLPIGNSLVPTEQRPWESVFPDAKLAVRSATNYYLGNISDIDPDGIIEKGKAAAVTVTLNNIRIEFADPNRGGRGGCFAEIVSIRARD